MAKPPFTIDENTLVTDIINHDYRTADVLRKYHIDFCCTAKWPLFTICQNQDLDTEQVKKELEDAMRVIQVSPTLPFHEWPLDFLSDYLIHVHHAYLRQQLPQVHELLEKFVKGHIKKYAYLGELQDQFTKLHNAVIPHIQQEEAIIFPYIKQLSRAYNNRESYAGLLVRTLRKPVETVMQHEHEGIEKTLRRMRSLTGNYTPVANACPTHKVTFARLHELDNDLVQHVHLENDILFPRALAIEKELISKNIP